MSKKKQLVLTTDTNESQPFRSNRVLNSDFTSPHNNFDDPLFFKNSKRSIKQKRNSFTIRSFVQKLKSKTMINSTYQNLSDQQMNLIGDLTNHRQQQQGLLHLDIQLINSLKLMFIIIQQWIVHKFEKLPIIMPESKIKLGWDTISIVSRLYFLYLIPLDLGWQEYSFLFDIYYYHSLYFGIILFIDVLIALTSAYYSCGQLVTNRIKIVKHTLFRAFGLECLSVIQLIVFLIATREPGTLNYIKINNIYVTLLIFLVHYQTVQEQVTLYEEALNLSKKVSSIIELIKLVAFIFYIIHVFSCFWYWVGHVSSNTYDKSWIQTADIVDADWDIQYLESLYYTAVTMFTVGYGDVTPKSNLEKIVSIIFIMAASLQLPYSINTVGAIIQQISDLGAYKKRKLRIINTYLHKKKIPFQIQNEVRQYLNYYWQLDKGDESKEYKRIIHQLSEQLQEKIVMASNQAILDQCSLFKYKFSTPFKNMLIKKLQPSIISPETIIDLEDNLIHIESGEIQAFADQDVSQYINYVKAGDTLNLQNLIIGSTNKIKYKSIGFTILMVLKRQDFLQSLKDFPNDYEIYCELRDELIYNKVDKHRLLIQQCQVCQSTQHSIDQCRLIHFVADRELILKRFCYSSQQKRTQHERRVVRKHAFAKVLQNQEAAFIIASENNDLCNLYNIKEEDIEYKAQKAKININYDRKMQIKESFRRIVKKLIQIDKMYPQFMIKAKQHLQEYGSFISYSSQLKTLSERISILKSTHYQDLINLSELKLLQLKLQKLTEANNNNYQQSDFETFTTYDSYESSKIKQQLQNCAFANRIKLLQQYMPYFLYPWLVIKQFNLNRDPQKLITYKRRQNVVLFQINDL